MTEHAFIPVGLIKLQGTHKKGDLSRTNSCCSPNGALPSSSADLSPSRFKVGRLVTEFVMAYLTVQELVIRSFVKPADCFACSFSWCTDEQDIPLFPGSLRKVIDLTSHGTVNYKIYRRCVSLPALHKADMRGKQARAGAREQ